MCRYFKTRKCLKNEENKKPRFYFSSLKIPWMEFFRVSLEERFFMKRNNLSEYDRALLTTGGCIMIEVSVKLTVAPRQRYLESTVHIIKA